MNKIPESELIINPDGSIYHLKLQPWQLADTVLLVGDPGRVEMIAGYFDNREYRVENREFITITGSIGKKRITVLSTGIGTDNIDIVLNELDALVNIDFEARTIKEERGSLNLIRLGTSGALQADIEVDTLVAASWGLGIDGLMRFYRHQEVLNEELADAFVQQTSWPAQLAKPYFVQASQHLLHAIAGEIQQGITATSCGFYAPQGRMLRLTPTIPDIQQRMMNFRYQDLKILNFEMETSALYGLSKALGHNALTICAVIANRIQKQYSKDYKQTVRLMIEQVLEKIQNI